MCGLDVADRGNAELSGTLHMAANPAISFLLTHSVEAAGLVRVRHAVVTRRSGPV